MTAPWKTAWITGASSGIGRALAARLAEQGVRLDEARRLAWRALVQDPLNGYVVDTLGWCELRAGNVDAAVSTLERADRPAPRRKKTSPAP